MHMPRIHATPVNVLCLPAKKFGKHLMTTDVTWHLLSDTGHRCCTVSDTVLLVTSLTVLSKEEIGKKYAAKSN